MRDLHAAVLGGIALLLIGYLMYRAGQPGPVAGATATVRAVFGGRESAGSYGPLVMIAGAVFVAAGVRTSRR